MRAIIIDPFTRTVTDTSLPDGTLASIRRAIFGEVVPHSVTTTSLGGGIDMWLDDEGMLREDRSQRFFHFHTIRPALPMSGRGVMLGVTRDGNSVGLPGAITVDDVGRMITFLGDDDGLEAAIAAGAVVRPQSTMREPDGRVTVMWEWRPSPKAED